MVPTHRNPHRRIYQISNGARPQPFDGVIRLEGHTPSESSVQVQLHIFKAKEREGTRASVASASDPLPHPKFTIKNRRGEPKGTPVETRTAELEEDKDGSLFVTFPELQLPIDNVDHKPKVYGLVFRLVVNGIAKENQSIVHIVRYDCGEKLRGIEGRPAIQDNPVEPDVGYHSTVAPEITLSSGMGAAVCRTEPDELSIHESDLSIVDSFWDSSSPRRTCEESSAASSPSRELVQTVHRASTTLSTASSSADLVVASSESDEDLLLYLVIRAALAPCIDEDIRRGYVRSLTEQYQYRAVTKLIQCFDNNRAECSRRLSEIGITNTKHADDFYQLFKHIEWKLQDINSTNQQHRAKGNAVPSDSGIRDMSGAETLILRTEDEKMLEAATAVALLRELGANPKAHLNVQGEMKAVFRILLVDTRFIDLELANSVQEALSRLCKGHDVRVVRAQNKCLELLCTASLASFFELQEALDETMELEGLPLLPNGLPHMCRLEMTVEGEPEVIEQLSTAAPETFFIVWRADVDVIELNMMGDDAWAPERPALTTNVPGEHGTHTFSLVPSRMTAGSRDDAVRSTMTPPVQGGGKERGLDPFESGHAAESSRDGEAKYRVLRPIDVSSAIEQHKAFQAEATIAAQRRAQVASETLKAWRTTYDEAHSLLHLLREADAPLDIPKRPRLLSREWNGTLVDDLGRCTNQMRATMRDEWVVGQRVAAARNVAQHAVCALDAQSRTQKRRNSLKEARDNTLRDVLNAAQALETPPPTQRQFIAEVKEQLEGPVADDAETIRLHAAEMRSKSLLAEAEHHLERMRRLR